MAIAGTIFFISEALEISGFATGNVGAIAQPDSALLMIRWLIAPIPALSLVCGLLLAAAYPLSQTAHAEIMLKLNAQRRSLDEVSQY